jgi:hypothetical protein
MRNSIHSIFREVKDAALCSILMNETTIIDIHKKKDTDIHINDILLL